MKLAREVPKLANSRVSNKKWMYENITYYFIDNLATSTTIIQ